jgi:hypothetical protein
MARLEPRPAELRQGLGKTFFRKIFLASWERRRHGCFIRIVRERADVLWKNGFKIYPAMLVIKNKVLEP